MNKCNPTEPGFSNHSRQLMKVDETPYCVTHDGTLMLTCRSYQLRMDGPGRIFNLLQKTDPRVVFDAQWQPLYGPVYRRMGAMPSLVLSLI